MLLYLLCISFFLFPKEIRVVISLNLLCVPLPICPDSERNVQPGFQCKGDGIAGLQGICIVNCILCAKLLCDVMVTVSTLPRYMKVPKYFKIFTNMINLNCISFLFQLAFP